MTDYHSPSMTDSHPPPIPTTEIPAEIDRWNWGAFLLNWIWGVALFMVTLTFAFTGYSLVYDQLSYWATTIGTNMIAAVPLIGEPSAKR